jgi:hypothetical protein
MEAYNIKLESSTVTMMLGILVLSAIGGSILPLIVISSVHPKRTLGGAA